MRNFSLSPRPRLRTAADYPGLNTRVDTGEPRFVRNWLSADLGQAADWTAIVAGQTYAATERTYQRGAFEASETLAVERTINSYRIVNAHRPRLGTSYPVIAAQIKVFLEDMEDADLLVDATGVGRGVVDIIRSRGMKPIAITITGGENVHDHSAWEVSVPKTELVSALIATSQEGRLRIAPELPLRDVMTKEIAAFSPRHTASGRVSYEGREGENDDLVLSLAMGIWHQERPRPQPARACRIDLFGR